MTQYQPRTPPTKKELFASITSSNGSRSSHTTQDLNVPIPRQTIHHRQTHLTPKLPPEFMEALENPWTSVATDQKPSSGSPAPPRRQKNLPITNPPEER